MTNLKVVAIIIVYLLQMNIAKRFYLVLFVHVMEKFSKLMEIRVPLAQKSEQSNFSLFKVSSWFVGCLTAIKDDGFRKQCDSSYNCEKKKMFASDLRPNWATNKFPYDDLQEKRGLQLYKMLGPLFPKNLFPNTSLVVMHTSFFQSWRINCSKIFVCAHSRNHQRCRKQK